MNKWQDSQTDQSNLLCILSALRCNLHAMQIDPRSRTGTPIKPYCENIFGIFPRPKRMCIYKMQRKFSGKRERWIFRFRTPIDLSLCRIGARYFNYFILRTPYVNTLNKVSIFEREKRQRLRMLWLLYTVEKIEFESNIANKTYPKSLTKCIWTFAYIENIFWTRYFCTNENFQKMHTYRNKNTHSNKGEHVWKYADGRQVSNEGTTRTRCEQVCTPRKYVYKWWDVWRGSAGTKGVHDLYIIYKICRI